jgi:hypothetical protein
MASGVRIHHKLLIILLLNPLEINGRHIQIEVTQIGPLKINYELKISI